MGLPVPLGKEPDRPPTMRERCEAIVFESIQALDVALSRFDMWTEEAAKLLRIRDRMRVHMEEITRMAYRDASEDEGVTGKITAVYHDRKGDIPVDAEPNPRDSLEAVKKWHVRRATQHHPSLRQAAKSLGISQKTLWEMRRKWELDDLPYETTGAVTYKQLKEKNPKW